MNVIFIILNIYYLTQKKNIKNGYALFKFKVHFQSKPTVDQDPRHFYTQIALSKHILEIFKIK